ncbi:response regulator [Sphingobacterium hungaricum]
MFKKVLIAEDHESTNISIQKTLQDLEIPDARYVYYCDDALSRIQVAVREGDPYDLLITDLSFEEDHHKQKIADGKELVQAAREVQPDLKVIVFSAESRDSIIDELYKIYGINGYVRKARRDAQSLKDAFQAIYRNKIYYSSDFKQAIREKNSHEFSTLDLAIVSYLSQGVRQKSIPDYLQEKSIRPSSLSSVEKRLNLMKDVLGLTNNEQLVVYCRDKGLI